GLNGGGRLPICYGRYVDRVNGHDFPVMLSAPKCRIPATDGRIASHVAQYFTCKAAIGLGSSPTPTFRQTSWFLIKDLDAIRPGAGTRDRGQRPSGADRDSESGGGR